MNLFSSWHEAAMEFGSPSAWSVAAEYSFRALAFCKHISASLQCERLEYRFARPCQISNSVTPSSSPYSKVDELMDKVQREK